MKRTRYFHKGFALDVDTVNLYDMMALNAPFKTKMKSYKTWNEFFADQIENSDKWKTYATKRFKKSIWGNYLWRLIVRTFLEMLMHDLIYENDRFFLPHWRKKLYMSMTVRDNKKTWWYKYNPLTGGDDYQPEFTYLSQKQRISMKKSLYYIYFTRRWRNKYKAHSIKFSYN